MLGTFCHILRSWWIMAMTGSKESSKWVWTGEKELVSSYWKPESPDHLLYTGNIVEISSESGVICNVLLKKKNFKNCDKYVKLLNFFYTLLTRRVTAPTNRRKRRPDNAWPATPEPARSIDEIVRWVSREE